jgi:hypothetical protein
VIGCAAPWSRPENGPPNDGHTFWPYSVVKDPWFRAGSTVKGYRATRINQPRANTIDSLPEPGSEESWFEHGGNNSKPDLTLGEIGLRRVWSS